MITLYDDRSLDEQINALERHIASRRASLPYIERGYVDEAREIKRLEQQLMTLKAQRDAGA